MHPPADTSPNGTANQTHLLTYEGAEKIIQKLSPDTVEHIFRFISGEEVMRTADIAQILGYLGWKDIMRARVSRKWREAAKKTLVPTNFKVNSVRSYNAMRVLTTALPNMQRLRIVDLDEGHKYSDGEDPDPDRNVHSGNYITHDINIISNFRKLRALTIYYSPLNGRYPVLFNFPLLEELNLWDCNNEFESAERHSRQVDIRFCPNIRGHFMDLADFPHLKYLNLYDTSVSGDIRGIGRNDFPALETLFLPKTVNGGVGYKFHSVSDVPSFMQAIYLLIQRTPGLFSDYHLENAFLWELSKDSDQWYDWEYDGLPPPFKLECVRAGSHFGWRWTSYHADDDFDDEDEEDRCQACEVNWLDAGPNSKSIHFADYIDELETEIFRGYTQPPTKDEFRQLLKQGKRKR